MQSTNQTGDLSQMLHNHSEMEQIHLLMMNRLLLQTYPFASAYPVTHTSLQNTGLGCEANNFLPTGAAISNVDQNVLIQLILQQQQQINSAKTMLSMAQEQQREAAFQTEALLNMIAPLTNPGQVTLNLQEQCTKLKTETAKPKKDPKEKYRKPGNKQYKLEMCKSFEETGTCKYGKKCQFAHGEEDLRSAVSHPKFKTSPCETILNGGECAYGSRCKFIHPNDPQALPGMFQCEVLSSVTTPERRLPIFEELAPSISSAVSSRSDE